MTKPVRTKPVRMKSVTHRSVVEAEKAVSPMRTVSQPADETSDSGFVEIRQAVSRRFSSLAGAGGFAAVVASATLFAACYARAEREATASYYGISTSLVPVDPYSALLPAILALAAGAAIYGVLTLVAIGISVARHLSKDKQGRRDGAVRRWLRRLRASRMNKAPVPGIAKSIPTFTLIVAAAAALTSAYLAGDYLGRSEAHHGKQFLVLSDPKWCPPRPAGVHENCVIIAENSGVVVTRWIDADTGRLGSATTMWPDLGGGAVTTAMWFPVVRPPVVPAAS